MVALNERVENSVEERVRDSVVEIARTTFIGEPEKRVESIKRLEVSKLLFGHGDYVLFTTTGGASLEPL